MIPTSADTVLFVRLASVALEVNALVDLNALQNAEPGECVDLYFPCFLKVEFADPGKKKAEVEFHPLVNPLFSDKNTEHISVLRSNVLYYYKASESLSNQFKNVTRKVQIPDRAGLILPDSVR